MKNKSAYSPVGRQLFVDDFLIENTDLIRVWHAAEPAEEPVLRPETALEKNHGIAPFTAVFNDGCWYDPADGLYKLFYNAGWYAGTALAVSGDGLHWERPDLGIVKGTNLLFEPSEARLRDGSLCWLDQHAENQDERWKMFLFFRYPQSGTGGGLLYTSADGIHWKEREKAGPCGDNSSFFYDPFRRDWCFSVRTVSKAFGRARGFVRRKNFIDRAWDKEPDSVLHCDGADLPDRPEPSFGNRSELYDFNAVPYESLLLGCAAIFEGPENHVCFQEGRVKTIHLQYAFSRDGENWIRPQTREMYLRCTGREGDWNRGYLHCAGGIALVFRDRLLFYYSGWSGKSTLGPNQAGPRRDETAMYASSSIGCATLRRDGFASMTASDAGSLTTKLLETDFPGLWINARAENLRIGLLDAGGKWIPGYAPEDCVPFSGDSVGMKIAWRDRPHLPRTPFRIVFELKKGDLYSFWFSPSEKGESLGFVAAGSGDYPGDRDVPASPRPLCP